MRMGKLFLVRIIMEAIIMIISGLEDKLYTILFYALLGIGVFGMVIWVDYITKHRGESK